MMIPAAPDDSAEPTERPDADGPGAQDELSRRAVLQLTGGAALVAAVLGAAAQTDAPMTAPAEKGARAADRQR